MSKVLIVYYSLSGNTKAAAEAVAEGVRKVKGAEPLVMEALKAGVDELLDCAALAVGTPDYFSYMAGGVKDFFDRTYYPTQGKVTDKPVGIFVTHGGGGKAVESVKSICRSFKFRLACAPVSVQNRPDEEAVKKLQDLGVLLGKLAVEG
jgi:flavorubredoxin